MITVDVMVLFVKFVVFAATFWRLQWLHADHYARWNVGDTTKTLMEEKGWSIQAYSLTILGLAADIPIVLTGHPSLSEDYWALNTLHPLVGLITVIVCAFWAYFCDKWAAVVLALDVGHLALH